MKHEKGKLGRDRKIRMCLMPKAAARKKPTRLARFCCGFPAGPSHASPLTQIGNERKFAGWETQTLRLPLHIVGILDLGRDRRFRK
ncbi:MAG: hypothetical protein RLZZ214_516 [Verrucomicrobiota bacterium]